MRRSNYVLICSVGTCLLLMMQCVNLGNAALQTAPVAAHANENAPFLEIHSPVNGETYVMADAYEAVLISLNYTQNTTFSSYFMEVLGYTAATRDLAVFMNDDYVGPLAAESPKSASFWAGVHNVTILAGAYGSGHPNTTACETTIFTVVDPSSSAANDELTVTDEGILSFSIATASAAVAIPLLALLKKRRGKRRHTSE